MAALKERSAIELLEEAFHLLREAPASQLLLYYLGTLPFLLGVLFFWAEMAHSAFAAARCTEESLGVAVLYIWMAFWQARFAHGLYAQVSGSPAPVPVAVWRTAYLQALVQSTKLFVLPVASLCLLPLASVFAFYQNAAVLADAAPNLRSLVSKAARQAAYRSRQNWMLVSILSLFSLFAFLNLLVTLFLAPHLVKMLFGIESAFSRSGGYLLNSTLIAAAAGLAWAAVDPLIKAVYVLRCFYGESVTTGADLKAAISTLRRAATLVCLLAAVCPAIRAQSPIPPSDLDRSIDQVIHRPTYAWRMPRNAVANDESHGFLGEAVNAMDRELRRAAKWFQNFLEWLREKFREEPSPADSTRGNLRSAQKLRWLLYALIALLIIAAVVLLLRVLRAKRIAQPVMQTAEAAPAENLADDRLEADKIPEDRWLTIAQELMARGELRTAVRALYLASLSYLARHALVTVQAAKTNRQYEAELRRRTRDKIDVARLFSENARVFERAWYGDHIVSMQIVESFQDNLQRMKARAES
ncbi:MAG TPA: DUF4129 domain-containing protein [Bryobacteraceae bacterium]|nr:DUF4129 domain-containing protein [Bryobacteraceae bacterium]